jgi:hypothetical protein
LLGTVAVPRELDAVVTRLKADQIVDNASWTLRTTE